MITQAVLTAAELGTCEIVSLEGREAVSELPRWSVTVATEDPQIDLEQLVGTEAVIVIGDEDGGRRTVPLLIVDLAYVGEAFGGKGQRYDLELSSRLWLHTQRRGYRIFLDKTVSQIVTEVLTDAGWDESRLRWRLSEPLYEREQCVQYDESEHAFIDRLLADEGISLWHEADPDGQLLLVLGDSPGAHDPIDGGGELRFDDGSGLSRSASSLFELERSVELTSESVHVADYDIRQPDVLIEGKAGDHWRQHYEYPARTRDAAAAQRRAEVRLGQLRRLADTAEAKTHSVRCVPGRLVTVSGLADEEHNGDYVIARVEHTLRQATAAGGDARPYTAKCLLVRHDGEQAFRPPLPPRPPAVDGLDSALVTGPAGEEIHVDDLGRVKLRFPWDRSGIGDDRSSFWARSLQLNLDGSMMLPRVGWEVSTAFRDGSPDRPVVLGRLYNGETKPPYPLPAQKATASFMSATTPGGGSVNEVRLCDDAGQQSFAVQASGDQGESVGGDRTITVGANEDHHVKGNLTTHIKGSQSVTVGANQSIDVGGPFATKIKGGRSVSVGATETIGVDLNRTLQCSGYTEAVGGLYFLQCNNHADSCKATFAQAVGGAMVVAAACGLNELVLGARSEVVGGPRLVAAGSLEDKTYGAKIISCGAQTLSAGAKLMTAVKSAASVKAGASSVSGGSKVVLRGASVTITASAITVTGSYKAAGAHSVSGDLNLKNSTANYKAVTKTSG